MAAITDGVRRWRPLVGQNPTWAHKIELGIRRIVLEDLQGRGSDLSVGGFLPPALPPLDKPVQGHPG